MTWIKCSDQIPEFNKDIVIKLFGSNFIAKLIPVEDILLWRVPDCSGISSVSQYKFEEVEYWLDIPDLT